MRVEKSFVLARPRDLVWSKFSDPVFVAECLPGASIVGDLGGGRYKGRMSVKVGPMAAAFDGEVAIETQPQDWRGSVTGKGADPRSNSRVAGSLTYRLSEGDGPGATRVDIVADFNLAGALAQFGKGAVIQEIASRITAAFIETFEARLEAAGTSAASAIASEQPAAGTAPQSLDAGNLLWTILRDRLRAFWRGLLGRSSAAL
jgi:uncharacterized protein